MKTSRSFCTLAAPLGGVREALPADGLADLARYGVIAGRRVHQARQFRHVTLPPGWAGVNGSYGMWDRVVDQHGRTRAVISWQPYDYPAPSSKTLVIDVGIYALSVAERGAPFALDDEWATPEAFTAAVRDRIGTLQHLVDADDQSMAQWGDHWLGEHFGWLSEWRASKAAKLAANQALLARVVS
jgi:hypothetical protein